MNKAIYICAAMALMLASCSSDETVELAKDKGISFRSIVGLNTRALNTDTPELQKDGKLYVTTFTPDGERRFEETEYVYDNDNMFWIAQPAQTWGIYDRLSFFLTYPKLGEWQNNAELTKDNKTVTVTVDEDIPDQKDYLAAYLNVEKTQQSATGLKVDLQHLFSSIEINAKNDNKAFQYKVRGIRICGVNKQVSIDLSKINDADFAVGQGTLFKNYELTYDTPVELEGKAKSLMGDAGNAILPPQDGGENLKWNGTQTSDDADGYCGSYISVLINLTATAGANIYPAGSTAGNETYGWVSAPVSFSWESGKKYVYTLDFSDGAGKVDPTDPGDDVNPGGKDPDKVTDPDKAEPVLGGLIKFGLTVTKWNTDDEDLELNDKSKFGVTVDDWEGDETNDATVK